jgi:hypothetical protein
MSHTQNTEPRQQPTNSDEHTDGEKALQSGQSLAQRGDHAETDDVETVARPRMFMDA